MAIKGLTDKGPSLPQIAVLRKGAPKPASGPGKDLKYFRFDTEDAEADKRFKEAYGAEPVAIRVFLPFATTDENFEAWREAWTASSLQHRCDGENCVRWLQPNGTYSDAPKPCPGGCKQVGRLKVIIPELKRWAFVTTLTTSIHDIIELHANLMALEGARGDLRGIPLILKRAPRKISTPRNNGERQRAEKWLLTIEAQPQWVELQLANQERAALNQAEQPLALPEWNGEEEIEDVEEVTADAPEMITDAQLKMLTGIVDELEKLGVAREQWRGGILSFTSNATDELAELTSEQAAKIIPAFSRRLDERRADAQRKTAKKEVVAV
jgi:hypothetical protein